MVLSGFAPVVLPTTLCLAAAGAVINCWLMIRIGQVRMARKIELGDGGDAFLLARMRAQANFIETAPLALILFALVELTGKGSWWLGPVGAIFMLGRVAHAIGMDGKFKAGRAIGTVTALLTQLGLATFAVLTSLNLI
jgi:uncharacterized membrane protein YecN with MAPEG domain